MTRPTWIEGVIGAMPGTPSYAGGWSDIAITESNLWGNGYDLLIGGSDRWTSQHSMFVADTDATIVRVRRNITGVVADGEYACGFVMTGTVGALYGTTLASRLTAPVGTTGSRTTTHRLPPGFKRIFIGGCAYSGVTGQRLQAVSFPSGSSVSVVSEPSVGTVAIDGAGSLRFSTDGFVVTGGALSMSGANVTLRNEFGARVARVAPGEVLCTVGTNTFSDGVTSSDYELVLHAWVDVVRAAAPLADIVLMSMLRRGVADGAGPAAYRAATANVCSARGARHIDGLPVLSAADLGSDQLHPTRQAQSKIASVVLLNTTTSKRLLVYTDSIFSGSSDPNNGVGYTGPVHLVRAGRAFSL